MGVKQNPKKKIILSRAKGSLKSTGTSHWSQQGVHGSSWKSTDQSIREEQKGDRLKRNKRKKTPHPPPPITDQVIPLSLLPLEEKEHIKKCGKQ